jgi:predicted nucleotidyltransferase component of viral defense system
MKEFIEALAKKLDIQRKELIEKDIRIHLLLADLSQNAFFSHNFVFKGGTCLISCYLGYFRFSEDIDFTWVDQSLFQHKSQKEIRRKISGLKNTLGLLIASTAKKHGFDFQLHGPKNDYIEFGGGNKTITYKLWYDSVILKTRSFIKIQINFVDILRFPPRKQTVQSLFAQKKDTELAVLFEKEYAAYTQEILLRTYDIKEILCEKVRAILTRQGIKARDFVDLYLIEKQTGTPIRSYTKEIIEKTQFILDLYEKYQTNFAVNARLMESGTIFRWGAERDLLLLDIDEKEFYRFVQKLQEQLHDIVQELSATISY